MCRVSYEKLLIFILTCLVCLSYLVLSDHTVTVCDFSHETCDARMVMVCKFVIEAYMVKVAYKILLIFIGYYCLVFSWTVYVGVTLWWSITLGQVVISPSVFLLWKLDIFMWNTTRCVDLFQMKKFSTKFIQRLFM